jgi:hypothetical protein
VVVHKGLVSAVTETSRWHHGVVRQAPYCQFHEKAPVHDHGPCRGLTTRAWDGPSPVEGGKN